jgi:hypothetical protein
VVAGISASDWESVGVALRQAAIAAAVSSFFSMRSSLAFGAEKPSHMRHSACAVNLH